MAALPPLQPATNDIRPPPPPPPPQINNEGDKLIALFKADKTGKLSVKKLNTSTPLLSAAIFVDSGGGHAVFGQLVCVVRCPAVDIISFAADNQSNFKTIHQESSVNLKAYTVDKRSNHHYIFYQSVRFPPPAPFQDREFLGSFLWKKLNDSQYMCLSHPTEHTTVPRTPGVVRASLLRVILLTKLSPTSTRYESFSKLDMGGHIPTLVVEKVVAPRVLLQGPSVQQLYAIQTKRLADYDAAGEDGIHLGQLLMDGRAKAEKRREDEDHFFFIFFTRVEVLRDLSSSYPWFQVFVTNLVKNKLRPPSTNSTPLPSFTDDDARKVGRSFASILLGNLTHDSAVDEYIMSYPALKQVSRARGHGCCISPQPDTQTHVHPPNTLPKPPPPPPPAARCAGPRLPTPASWRGQAPPPAG